MSKRKHEIDYAAALENEYARWDELFTKGGSDPFWTDGSNLSLVRNHILYYKEQLAKQENSLFGLPDVYYRETPPEVDPNYMARPDEIRENARKTSGHTSYRLPARTRNGLDIPLPICGET